MTPGLQLIFQPQKADGPVALFSIRGKGLADMAVKEGPFQVEVLKYFPFQVRVDPAAHHSNRMVPASEVDHLSLLSSGDLTITQTCQRGMVVCFLSLF